MEILEVQSMSEKEWQPSEADRDNHLNNLPPAPSIPRARDPIALAGVTVQAVDQIGESAAAEIDTTAEALEDAAIKIRNELRTLAAAVREHSRIAEEHVAEFVKRSVSVIEMTRALKERLDATGEPKKGNGIDRLDGGRDD
jgi:hypothetical protein